MSKTTTKAQFSGAKLNAVACLMRNLFGRLILLLNRQS